MQSEILAHWDDYQGHGRSAAATHDRFADPVRRLPAVSARIGFRPLQIVRFMAIFTGCYSRRVVLEKKMQLSGQ